MSKISPVCAANALMIQHFARSYLSAHQGVGVVSIEGACINTTRIANRSGVPDDAITLSHLVEHPELGFAFRFRAVWRGGHLFHPPATHVVIHQEWDEGDHGSPAAVSMAINQWLRAVTL